MLGIDRFVPDEHFDVDLDLVEIDLNGQKLYVSSINTMWGVRIDDATMSESMLDGFRAQEANLPRSPGVRLDVAEMGSRALFGAANWDWRGIWRSQEDVTGFKAVRRTRLLRSTVIIEENRQGFY